MVDLQRKADFLAIKIASEYGCIHDCTTLPALLSQALLTAYNEGAGQFRERAAKLCDTFKSASSPSAIGNQIRALPLTEGEP